VHSCGYKVRVVDGAVLNLEYKLFKEVPLGDHTMFVGEVVTASINRYKKYLMFQILSSVYRIVELYKTDRAVYDQEFDNQFILSENRAFGEFDLNPDTESVELFDM